MEKTMLTNRQLLEILEQEVYEKWSWSMLTVYLICSDTGMYFQVDDWYDNTVLIAPTLTGLSNYLKEHGEDGKE